jgi:hypothetical protein
MSIEVLWSRFSTNHIAIFAAAHAGCAGDSHDACEARGDAGILVSEFVAWPLWTAGPRRAKRLLGHQNPQRRARGVYEDRT